MNFSKLTLKELKQIAKKQNLKNFSKLNKENLVKYIGGESTFSRLGSKFSSYFTSKNSKKIENNNFGVYNPTSSSPKNANVIQVTHVNKVNNSLAQTVNPVESNNLQNKKQNNTQNKINNLTTSVNVEVIKNNNENKINKLKQILNMNNSNAIIYFSQDIIKKLIDFELKLIKYNIDKIGTIAKISSFINFEDLLSSNQSLIDKMILNIRTSYLMSGTNLKLINLTAILLKNLKDLKKLKAIQRMKNNTQQKNINSFSSNEIKNYKNKVLSNIPLTKNTKKFQTKKKIYTNLQNRLNKLK